MTFDIWKINSNSCDLTFGSFSTWEGEIFKLLPVFYFESSINFAFFFQIWNKRKTVKFSFPKSFPLLFDYHKNEFVSRLAWWEQLGLLIEKKRSPWPLFSNFLRQPNSIWWCGIILFMGSIYSFLYFSFSVWVISNKTKKKMVSLPPQIFLRSHIS